MRKKGWFHTPACTEPKEAWRFGQASLAQRPLLAVGAGMYAGFPNMATYVFGVALVICMMPAILFLVKPKRALAKAIEIASALWTLLMYLALGAIPMLANLI
jgi:hypothetical protein